MALALPKSFFMFCYGEDFATRLSVPKGFAENHGLNHRRRLSLRLKVEPAARSWDVKMENINGRFYIAGDGWSKFVNDNGLLEMKLLVFYIVDDSTLHVSIFDQDSCLETNNPSFYKILMDIPTVLRIPEGFMDMYGDDDVFTGEMKLRNALGATWEVEFEKVVEDDRYGFTTGWAEFCRDMGLDVFDLLLFHYAGDATFDVSVYAATALEKDPRFRPFLNPCWRVTLQHHHYNKLHIVNKFVEDAGLKGRNKIRVEYCAGGPSTQVTLNIFKRRVAFGSGWSKFQKENKLAFGKTYTLEFVPMENVIRVWPC